MPDEPTTGATLPGLVPLHERVLEFWDRFGIPGRLLGGRADGPEFRFTEGPPTANGVPHLGHLVARVLKDTHLRYRRMRGYRIVSPMAGWDCHGLPVELEIEKKHGLKSKREIEAYGVEKFCDECRTGALETASVWREMSRRLGYWLDYDHPYFTMDANYIESVWWSLKTLFDRELLTRGYYVLPYCPRCETPLSSHEVAQGYREVVDPSVVVRFRLTGGASAPPRYLLTWTTTPWTLPANLLIAVRADLPYVRIRLPDGSEGILAEEAVARFFPTRPEVTGRLRGEELVGERYEPLFPFAGAGPNRYRVVADEMVDPREGTGFVHVAPSFGAEDQRVGTREAVGLFDPLDSRGVFTEKVQPVAHKFFKAADPILLDQLRNRGAVVFEATVRHTYPFCWRCGTALLYRAVDSWFVRTSQFTGALVRHNRSVEWTPEYLRDGRFGNFLTEAKDWALSRNRYWGTPLPIWVCPSGHAHCVGSLRELETLTGSPLPKAFDPHRVSVDPLTFPCPTCGAVARREPYTIDGWYDSGSAPFAQYHYPFEPGPFRTEAPLDLVAEGLDQTRGWFYALLVISTLLFDRPAYRASVTSGLVLDETGQKMSKSKGNTIEPIHLLSTQGGDAVRWAILVQDYTEPLRVSDGLVRQLGARTLTTWTNVVGFHAQNAAIDHLPPAQKRPEPSALLDRWLLSRLSSVTAAVTGAMDRYDARTATLALASLIDDLSTWYLRRSRPRFWTEQVTADRMAASDTLSFTLLTLGRLTAPFAPFASEYLYQVLLGTAFDSGVSSVHGTPWPEGAGSTDPSLENGMAELRRLVEVGRELRQRAHVRSRVPLPVLVLVGPAPPALDALGAEGSELLKEELNVRRVDRIPEYDPNSYPEQEWVRREEGERVVALLSRRPTPELIEEGWRREVLRRAQMLRKELNLRYTDRIELTLWATGPVHRALRTGRDELARALLADRLEVIDQPPPGEGVRTWQVEGVTFGARLRRAL